MGESVREYFGAIAHAYDARALRAQPRYQDMLAQVVASLPEEASNVLEMGCGTGALTVLVAKHYPAARLTAVDAAPEMVELAMTRLSAEGLYPDARIQFARIAFEDLQVPEHAYDLVTSNMSLHHVIDKERLYASLRIGLRRRGFLVFGDELTGALPYVEERHWNGWLNFSRLPGHLTEEEIADIVRHAEQLDHYETLPRQLDLLRAAGFDPVDCVWRYLNYGIFAGQA